MKMSKSLMNIGSYFTVKNLFTPDECDRIVSMCSDKQFTNGTVVASDGYQPRINKNLVIEKNPANEWIYQRLYEFAMSFNSEKFRLNVDSYAGFNSIQIAKYTYGGKYDWHVDVGPSLDTCFRKLSIVVQLSDESRYKGGDLQVGLIDEKADTISKNKGDALIFPSVVRHRVTPVTSGVRYSLVAWITGQPFV
jgi:PKHD-type hydroxylase